MEKDKVNVNSDFVENEPQFEGSVSEDDNAVDPVNGQIPASPFDTSDFEFVELPEEEKLSPTELQIYTDVRSSIDENVLDFAKPSVKNIFENIFEDNAVNKRLENHINSSRLIKDDLL